MALARDRRPDGRGGSRPNLRRIRQRPCRGGIGGVMGVESLEGRGRRPHRRRGDPVAVRRVVDVGRAHGAHLAAAASAAGRGAP